MPDPNAQPRNPPLDLRSAITLPEAIAPRGAWIELFRVRHLLWSAHTLPIANLPPALIGLRILHLTDIHVDGTWMPAWDTLLERVRQNPPDLILITGDFVERKYDSRHALPMLQRLLAGLTARLGVWGILGNHDGDVLAMPLAGMNVRLLSNQAVTLESGGATLQLIGIHGVHRDDLTPRVTAGFGPKPANTVRLVMAHYPDHLKRLVSLGPDVFLAGHTHGGQACLPGGWPLITHDSLPKRFCRGVHRINGVWLSVGRGMGFSTYPIRSFCPAQAIELTVSGSEFPVPLPPGEVR